jgi:hypothetical protein
MERDCTKTKPKKPTKNQWLVILVNLSRNCNNSCRNKKGNVSFGFLSPADERLDSGLYISREKKGGDLNESLTLLDHNNKA